MSSFLDLPLPYARFDDGSVAASLRRLPEQIGDAVAHFRPRITATMRASRTLYVAGMGGSGLGADLVRGLVARTLPAPIIAVREPQLPAAVRSGSLVVAISYSGGTAETLAAAKAARQRRVPMIVMTGGGALATLARRWRVPLYLIDTRCNPSGQPRLGIGFTAAAFLVLFAALGWRRFPKAEQGAAQAAAATVWRRWHPEVPTRANPLKQLAIALRQRFVLAVASDRFFGNAHILANQLNENAKTFAAPFALPELNHHLLEGLGFPTVVKRGAAVFLSAAGDEPLRRRFQLTEQVFRRQGLVTYRLPLIGRIPTVQAFGFLAETGLLSYYLALLHRVRPAAIPWVVYFKRALERGRG